MSAASRRPQGDPPIAVGLFEQVASAREALRELLDRGVGQDQLGMLIPSAQSVRAGARAFEASGLLGTAVHDVTALLVSMDIPEGEARFYGSEVAEKQRSLVAVRANGDYQHRREVLLHHGGYDVRARGAELAAADDAGVSGGTGPMPIDVTHRWEDVRSRYQMLWQQHYGTGDVAWEQMEPIYQFAWEAANEPQRRGRPWSEAEANVRRAWESSGNSDWTEVRGSIHDVWVDVAEEAMQGFEGGRDRQTSGPGADQEVAARDLLPPVRTPD